MNPFKLLIVVFGVALIVIGIGYAAPFLFIANPGPFDRSRFEAIVAAVRALGLKAGKLAELRLDDFADPKTLRPIKAGEVFERGQGAGCIWAEVTADGALRLSIETRDRGHAGEYGFAYSDTPLTSSGGTIDVPGLCYADPSMQIDAHWWKVEYRLD
jgi:hypothetical protein